jgi:hypothetical protein
MAADQLLAAVLGDLAEVAGATLLEQQRQEVDLEEHVAELVEQLAVVGAERRVGQLVGLLHRVRHDRALVLLAIPRALGPQAARQVVERAQGGGDLRSRHGHADYGPGPTAVGAWLHFPHGSPCPYGLAFRQHRGREPAPAVSAGARRRRRRFLLSACPFPPRPLSPRSPSSTSSRRCSTRSPDRARPRPPGGPRSRARDPGRSLDAPRRRELDGEQAPFAWLLARARSWRPRGSPTAKPARLLGPGDIFDPHRAGSRLLSVEHSWRALRPTTLAALDGRYLAMARRWPELTLTLQQRLCDEATRAAILAAIGHLPRVEQRVLALLWHVADRFGRPAPGAAWRSTSS